MGINLELFESKVDRTGEDLATAQFLAYGDIEDGDFDIWLERSFAMVHPDPSLALRDDTMARYYNHRQTIQPVQNIFDCYYERAFCD